MTIGIFLMINVRLYAACEISSSMFWCFLIDKMLFIFDNISLIVSLLIRCTEPDINLPDFPVLVHSEVCGLILENLFLIHCVK
jgi:hypothetical protein